MQMRSPGLLLAGTPEYRTKEYQTAQIDSRNVPELVSTSRIESGVDLDVLAQEQAGQGQRHQCAVRDAKTKASGGLLPEYFGRGPSIGDSEYYSHNEDGRSFRQEHPPEICHGPNGSFCERHF